MEKPSVTRFGKFHVLTRQRDSIKHKADGNLHNLVSVMNLIEKRSKSLEKLKRFLFYFILFISGATSKPSEVNLQFALLLRTSQNEIDQKASDFCHFPSPPPHISAASSYFAKNIFSLLWLIASRVHPFLLPLMIR
jgi:hypothetical protein